MAFIIFWPASFECVPSDVFIHGFIRHRHCLLVIHQCFQCVGSLMSCLQSQKKCLCVPIPGKAI